MKNRRRIGSMVVVGLCILGGGASCSLDGQSSPSESVDRVRSELTIAEVVGTWYLWANNFRCPITIQNPSGSTLTGTMTCEGAGTDPIDNISVSAPNWLEFRRVTNAGTTFQWFRFRVNQGVASGRFSSLQTPAKPALTSFAYHASGWRAESFPATGPVAFELRDASPNGGRRAKVRIDRDGSGNLVGRYRNWFNEDYEYELSNITWPNPTAPVSTLSFVVNGNGFTESHTMTVTGSTSDEGMGTAHWVGRRSDVLGYGLTSKAATAGVWQAATRSRLSTLMMDDAPLTSGSAGYPATPVPTCYLTTNHTPAACPGPLSQVGDPPVAAGPYAQRDDGLTAVPTNYKVTELRFQVTVPNNFSGGSSVRSIHGYLSIPTGSFAPGTKLPALVAVNGHTGSARQSLSPNSLFWYGDAFARRGYIVLAIDISHRGSTAPASPSTLSGQDRMYSNGNAYLNGDSASEGNGVHPPIAAPGFDSDWEEDGERLWDVMRGIDYLVNGRTDVDRSHLLLAGLSMGGEVTGWAGAMDARVSLANIAGWGWDMDTYLGGPSLSSPPVEHRCGAWQWAHIEEYVDASDVEALIAPRPLIVTTGQKDIVVSAYNPPFIASKQVARRVRQTYADLGAPSKFVHYLYINNAIPSDADNQALNAHQFHVGSARASGPPVQVGGAPIAAAPAVGVLVPVLTAPVAGAMITWQTDPAVTPQWPDLFQAISTLLP